MLRYDSHKSARKAVTAEPRFAEVSFAEAVSVPAATEAEGLGTLDGG
jgi:hypothetical protein